MVIKKETYNDDKTSFIGEVIERFKVYDDSPKPSACPNCGKKTYGGAYCDMSCYLDHTEE